MGARDEKYEPGVYLSTEALKHFSTSGLCTLGDYHVTFAYMYDTLSNMKKGEDGQTYCEKNGKTSGLTLKIMKWIDDTRKEIADIAKASNVTLSAGTGDNGECIFYTDLDLQNGERLYKLSKKTNSFLKSIIRRLELNKKMNEKKSEDKKHEAGAGGEKNIKFYKKFLEISEMVELELGQHVECQKLKQKKDKDKDRLKAKYTKYDIIGDDDYIKLAIKEQNEEYELEGKYNKKQKGLFNKYNKKISRLRASQAAKQNKSPFLKRVKGFFGKNKKQENEPTSSE